MATYTYTDKAVHTETLMDEFKTAGLDAVFYTKDSDLIVESSSLQSAVDAVVNAHTTSSLNARKHERITEIKDNSTLLLNKGVSVLVNAVTGNFGLVGTAANFGYYESLVHMVNRLPGKLPLSLTDEMVWWLIF